MEMEKHTCRAEVIDVNGSAALIVKTPPLPRRVTTNHIEFEGNLYVALASTGIPAIPSKLIWLIHIYPPEALVMDHDNISIKRVIDIICDFVSGGDSGLRCSIRQDSFMPGSLPDGTYILVMPLESEAPNRCEALEIITKWAKKHP